MGLGLLGRLEVFRAIYFRAMTLGLFRRLEVFRGILWA